MKIVYYKSFPEQRKSWKDYVVFILAHFYVLSLLPYFLLFLRKIVDILKKERKKFKYEVSICMIFKDEARFLNEWLTYYKLLGVNHFYLYNNNSSDNFRSILEPYIADGFVTLIDWPKNYAQIEAYEDCWIKTKNETHWLGFLDADEFLNLQSCDSIAKLLFRYKNYPAVFFNWRIFGTCGHISKEYKLVTEAFTSCWPNLCHIGKTFINNEFENFKINTHFSTSKVFGFPIFTISEYKIFNPYMCPVFSMFTGGGKVAYVNHYWSKDYEHYIYKDYVKGDVADITNLQIKKRKGRFEYHELQNSSRDYSIQRWLTFIKKVTSDFDKNEY